MNRFRLSPHRVAMPAALYCLLAAGLAHAGDPLPVTGALWDSPAPKQLSDNIEKARNEIAERENIGKGVKAGLGTAGKVADTAGKALEFQRSLNAMDDRLSPDYDPPGAPGIPSKCMENKACRPCFTQAYEQVNKTRTNLEKVRAHYEYTHRFSADGIALMQSVAASAGGPAGIGAAVETKKVNGALSDFDKVVRDKNAELLERLQGNLKEVNACEAKFYKNDDWYDRYGYMYYQFMAAHYGYANSHAGQ